MKYSTTRGGGTALDLKKVTCKESRKTPVLCSFYVTTTVTNHIMGLLVVPDLRNIASFHGIEFVILKYQ